ncbi:MAG: trehalase [Bacteroidia bacterium]|nr:trehalase [Bacteroidia bacterium]MBT8269138.1 trehalase [Bacteroidia bacterium]
MEFKLPIEETLNKLLSQEDTDGDKKITIEDKGPGAFELMTDPGRRYTLKGTYHLSNLLQELILAKNQGRSTAVIPIEKLEELPVDRVSRMIRDYYWKGLTRTMDAKGIERLIKDTKNEQLESETLRIYIPQSDALANRYYKELEKTHPVEAIRLPAEITPEYVKSINDKPGILALKLKEKNGTLKGIPFVVPGGRFNEMYGWDSYFESIGLLIDEKTDLAKAMADNFQYEIEHYGKILNANRSYYLTRTQPPFYSSLIREVFEKTKDRDWLKSHLNTAIKEYETVWMVKGKRLTENGLNRYLAEGIGIPPECEKGHFDSVLKPMALEKGIDLPKFIEQLNTGKLNIPELDEYFIHDRSVRESGHDTSYRIDGNCADLNLVELNAMLYKYETDFADLIREEFGGEFELHTSAYWLEQAEKRRVLVDQYLWSAEKGMYFDFDHKNNKHSEFIAATTLTPLWAKLCTPRQAEFLVSKALPLLKEKGGIAGCSKESVGKISAARPQRQWDYPNGWAPHQMMIWKGLLQYGYNKEAQELIYRWLFMITRNAVDYNGTIPEKYDVVEATHKVFAEYGNVGTEFEYITPEGFGWMNASYQYGLSLIDEEFRIHLNSLTDPELLF